MKRLISINLSLIFILVTLGCVTPANNYSYNKKRSVQQARSNVKIDRDDHGDLSVMGASEVQDSKPVQKALSSHVEEEVVIITNDYSGVKEEAGQNLLDTALDFVDVSQEFWSEGNLEDAIEALDQAYNLVLSVDTQDNPKLIQQKEDIRFMISKRILEIYASRYTAVSGKYEEIPLIMNKHVEAEIKRFTGSEKRFFLESYKRSGRYHDMILKGLKEAGMPEELSWLPLIESGFKIRALSSARALGLWQFIPSTGYKFGLTRDNWVDERLDPEKATAAAIAYMTELHNIFGDWTTVLAAYNCGEGRVLRLIRDQKINYLDNFWDLYARLPRETRRYVPRFLATLHILKDPAKYGMELSDRDTPEAYDVVEVEKTIQLKTVASELGTSGKTINDMNPELRYQVTPSKPYQLKVPAGMGNTLIAKLKNVPIWYPPEKVYTYHRVRKGETLSLIAAKYRSSVTKIVRENNIRKKHLIKIGQKLKIPLGTGKSAPVIIASEIPSGGIYHVRKGDSLWLIARKFNTNTKTLQRINNLRTTRLKIGQVLKVTENPPEPLPGGEYRVRKGDSLWLIAKKYNTDAKTLQKINNLRSTSIQVGQLLKVKK